MPCGCKKQTAMETQAESEQVRKLAAERQRRREARIRQVEDAEKTKAAAGKLTLVKPA